MVFWLEMLRERVKLWNDSPSTQTQDTDKTVRVECAFTAEDQTVSFRPTAGPDGREDGGGISVT